MFNWNWKCECCLLLSGILVGGPLGSQFYKIIKRTVDPSSGGGSTSHHFFKNDDTVSSSALSMLVPSSLWFLVTTSCVGCFFWVLGEILRKLHSATKITSSSTARSMDAASRRREAEDRGGGAGNEQGHAERRRDRELLGRLLGEGGGLLLEGHENILLIHHLVARGLILLPHEISRTPLRLWGISFL